MGTSNQLLLDLDTKEERMARQIDILTSKLDLYRKSIHAHIGALKNNNDELRHEIETLKKAIVRGDKIELERFL